MGRRTKLTPEVQKTIVETLRAGNYLRVAAARAAVDELTVLEWIARGEGRDDRPKTPLYAEFAKAVARARADAETEAVTQIKVAARTDWRAAAWYLERKHADEWAPRVRAEVSGPEGAPIHIVSEVAHAALVALIAAPGGAADAQRLAMDPAASLPSGNGHAPIPPLGSNGSAA